MADQCFPIRRAGHAFLGGYYAFPGGKVDLADRSADPLTDSPDAAWAIGTRRTGAGHASLGRGRARAFEETGMLLARDAAGRPPAGH
jgi:8-oxo-dGTP pyrophosphatase MutT (NUDIX family)